MVCSFTRPLRDVKLQHCGCFFITLAGEICTFANSNEIPVCLLIIVGSIWKLIILSSLKQYKKGMITCSVNAKQLPCSYRSSRVIYPSGDFQPLLSCSGLPHILHLCTQVCPFLFSLFSSDPVLLLVLILGAVFGSNFFCVTSPAWEWVQCLPREPFVFKDSSIDVSVTDYSAGCTSLLSWKTNSSASWKR